MEDVAVAVTVKLFYSFFIKMHDNLTCCRADSQVLFHSLHVSVKTQMACFFCQPFVFFFFVHSSSAALTCCEAAKGQINPSVQEVQLFALTCWFTHCREGSCKDLHSGLRHSTETRTLSPPLPPLFFSLSRWHPNTNSHWVLEQLSSRCSDSLLITPSRIHALQIG